MYRLWQLIDSALPTGFFAHSQGLESWAQAGGLPDGGVAGFARAFIQQQRVAVLPFLRQAQEDDEAWYRADCEHGLTLTNHVAERASRAQGQALLLTAGESFDLTDLDGHRRRLRRRDGGHLAPAFGAVCRRLAIATDDAARAFLYTGLRDLLSAAVRLGSIGPGAAQRLQHRLGDELDPAPAEAPWPGCQTHPLADLVQAGHDRLYSRLFSS